MSGDLTFDEGRHEYRIDGRILPSVTQVLTSLGFIDSAWFTEEARIRGTLTHKLCELWDKDELDRASVDPRLKGYLDAWIKYVRTEEMAWTEIERPMAHCTCGYAGTPDRIGFCKRGYGTVVDIKTGPPAPWHAWQIGGYLTMSPQKEARTVHLASDGTFKVEYHDVQEALHNWNAIFRTYQLLQKGKR